MPSRTETGRRPADERRDAPWLAAVALCCCLAAIPLAGAHAPATSDGLYHLLRAAELDRQLAAGIPYPRWAPDFYLGYGYPIFLFTPLLPYYLVVAVHLIGLPLLPAMNLVEAAALTASGVLTYCWLRRHVDAPAAAVGAILYALAPYHLVNLYYRGDLPEFLAATWFPAILLAVDALLMKPAARRILLLAFAVAALLLTHLLSALLFLPVAAVLGIVGLDWTALRSVRVASVGLAAVLLGASLSAFAWLPAVLMSKDATFGKLLRFYNYDMNFATAGQLFAHAPLQAYTPVFAGSSGFGYQLGLAQSAALALGMLALVWRWRRLTSSTRRRAVALTLVAVVSLAGCLRLSAPVWAALPPLQLVQFPWRLLAIAALPAALFAALAVDAVPQRRRAVVGLGGAFLVAASALVLVRPPRIALPADFTSVDGIARFELTYHLVGTSAAGEYLPPWASVRQTVSAVAFTRATGLQPSADPSADLPRWTPSGRGEAFSLAPEQSGTVTLPLLDFPGWTATLDGRAAPIQPAVGSGLVALDVPAGAHTVAIVWRNPAPVQFGGAVSLLGAVGTLVLVAVTWRTAGGRRRRAGAVFGKWGSRRRATVTARLTPPNVSAIVDAPGLSSGADRPSPAGKAPGVTRSVALVIVPIGAALVLAAVGGRALTPRSPALDATFAGGLHITGYSFATGVAPSAQGWRAQAGNDVGLTVQATGNAGSRVAVELTDAAATDWGAWQAPVVDGTAAFRLPLPPALPPGLYLLRLGAPTVTRSIDFAPRQMSLVQLLPVDGTLLVGPLTVDPPASVAPGGASPVAQWPGHAALLDPRLPAAVRAGTDLQPTWTWRAPLSGGGRLVESVHLVDATGHTLAAADTEPAAGLFPSPFWTPKEAVLDRPTLPIPADTPPGTYQLRIGLRLGNAALPAEDRAGAATGDEAVVGHLTVTPPTSPAAWNGKGVPAGALALELAQPLSRGVPGQPLTVALRWHRIAPPGVDYRVTLSLAAQGISLGSVSAPIGSASFPVSRWRPGETERQVLDLPLAGTAPAGPAQLAALVQPVAGPAVTIPLGAVDVVGRSHVFSATPATALQATFADGITLLGYDLRTDGRLWTGGTATAHQTLDVTLYWKAAGPTLHPLKVTVQLLSSANRLLAQADTEPEDGAAPTTSWIDGEVLTSRHALNLAGLPPGADRLVVALYDPATNTRLTSAGADAVTLTPVALP